MTRPQRILKRSQIQSALIDHDDFLRSLLQPLVQDILEAEMSEHLGAEKSERSEGRRGYRSGYYRRGLHTRVGKLELRVPQERSGEFSTELFNRYQRSEKALVTSLAEMYVQGVSTRKVKAITEQLCGHRFSASTISELNTKLDAQLEVFRQRRLEQEYPYVILDARDERVRVDGHVRSQAVLIALGISGSGHKEVMGVELANRESGVSWRHFIRGLQARGLRGVRLVISDDHKGLKKAIQEEFEQAVWPRCYVHFLRNALDYLPRKGDVNCLKELKDLYAKANLQEARRALALWLQKWSPRYGKLCNWVEENIEETFAFFAFPAEHRRRLRCTNLLERLNQEIKRRTKVVRIFPNEASALRLITALVVEIHEEWQCQRRYLNMRPLEEQMEENKVA